MLNNPLTKAHHIAGHCIVALLDGFPLTGARLADKGIAVSFAEMTKTKMRMVPSWCWAFPYLAGPISGAIHAGISLDLNDSANHWDRDYVAKLLPELVEDPALTIQVALTLTQRRCRSHWAAICAVADALLSHRELSRKTIEAIVAETGDPEPVDTSTVAEPQSIQFTAPYPKDTSNTREWKAYLNAQRKDEIVKDRSDPKQWAELFRLEEQENS